MNCKRGHSPWGHFVLGILVFVWRCCWLLENLNMRRPFDEIRLAVEALRWNHRRLYKFCEGHGIGQR